jgi:hypothetical protein
LRPLCSDKATYSVGSTYFVDGGMLKTVCAAILPVAQDVRDLVFPAHAP